MTSPNLQRGDRVEPCPLCEAAMLPYETRDWGTFHKHPMSDCPLSDFRIAPKHRQAWNTRQSPEAVTDETLLEAVKALAEILAAQQETNDEAERAKQPGANAWSSAPMVRLIHAHKRGAAALLKVSPR